MQIMKNARVSVTVSRRRQVEAFFVSDRSCNSDTLIRSQPSGNWPNLLSKASENWM